MKICTTDQISNFRIVKKYNVHGPSGFKKPNFTENVEVFLIKKQNNYDDVLNISKISILEKKIVSTKRNVHGEYPVNFSLLRKYRKCLVNSNVTPLDMKQCSSFRNVIHS
jgi:hypothetical protein